MKKPSKCGNASIVNLTHLGSETSASADWHGVISLGIFLIAKLTEEGLGHGERCYPWAGGPEFYEKGN